ncbi:MAG TPA: hypothetical protein VNL77_22425 [Roseiflexaceae bacterium]|nr:hypothetical protein [Roseiflexaceae bacterium]
MHHPTPLTVLRPGLEAAANRSADTERWDAAAAGMIDLITQAEIPELERLISDVAARHKTTTD